MKPGLVADPAAGVVVVVRVEPDPVRELDLRLRRPVDPVDAVGAAGDRRRDARVLGRRTRAAASSKDVGQRRRRPVAQPGSCRRRRDVQRDLEALRRVGGGLRVRERRVRVDVRRRAHALPVGDRAAGRAGGHVAGRSGRRCRRCAWSSPVITTAAFSPRGRYQKRGSGVRSRVHQRDQVRQQPLLLVGLRDRDLVQVDPVGLQVAGLGAEEQVVRAGRRRCRRDPGRPRPGCPGACRRPSARGRR